MEKIALQVGIYVEYRYKGENGWRVLRVCLSGYLYERKGDGKNFVFEKNNTDL